MGILGRQHLPSVDVGIFSERGMIFNGDMEAFMINAANS